jgi:hypothetical protein
MGSRVLNLLDELVFYWNECVVLLKRFGDIVHLLQQLESFPKVNRLLIQTLDLLTMRVFRLTQRSAWR